MEGRTNDAFSSLVGPLLEFFFADYLVAQRRVSPQTVASYRDTFRLLLQFVHRQTGIGPAALSIAQLDATIILGFLDNLESNRGNSVVSRNLRLTAIRSFYRMVALRETRQHRRCHSRSGDSHQARKHQGA